MGTTIGITGDTEEQCKGFVIVITAIAAATAITTTVVIIIIIMVIAMTDGVVDTDPQERSHSDLSGKTVAKPRNEHSETNRGIRRQIFWRNKQPHAREEKRVILQQTPCHVENKSYQAGQCLFCYGANVWMQMPIWVKIIR
ncbi:uncharacterized protein LOC119647130 [Hermetia illucens]|uniref:uncharacterized protein LOC119647130 n=1 Tax=Hermetia illucens TaxID=343691 RepID=UPI0018CC50FB|nr:uncharacterized protein LOC119647130 [Hermetia illucens]